MSKRRTAFIEEWKGFRASCAKMRNETARAACSRLCAAMLGWLSGEGDAPGETVIRATLRCKPRDALFYGSRAMATMIACEPARWPVVPALFGRASIPACESILTYVSSAASPERLVELIRLGLGHASPDVRRGAVQAAYFKRARGLLELYRGARRGEADPCVIADLDRYTSLKRDGYYATFAAGSWSWFIDYHVPEGLTSADVPKLVIDTIGIEAAVKHLKESARTGTGFVAWDEIVEGA